MPKRRPPSPHLTDKERMYRAAFEDAEERAITRAQLSVELDISVGTLSWWKSEIRRRDALRRGVVVKREKQSSEESMEFVPVTVKDTAEVAPPAQPAGDHGFFEVALPGGAVVRVPEAFTAPALTRLIQAVNAAC